MKISQESQQGQTPPVWYEFRNLVFFQRFDEAGSLLAKTPDLISMTDSCGETALHFLAIENAIEGVRWLRERGASINTVDAFGEPLIFSVAQLGYKDLFSWHVRQGADLSALSKDGLNLIAHLHEYEKEEMADWISTYFL
jgi:ankyrin repeat protein